MSSPGLHLSTPGTGGSWWLAAPPGRKRSSESLEVMRDLLKARALQASGWRASGRPVADVRVQVYCHIESDVIVWHLNDAARDLYRAAVARREPETRVEALPLLPVPVLLLDAVDYGLRTVILLAATSLW